MKKIPLTQGKFALVDDEDYNAVVSKGRWSAQKVSGGRNYYAQRQGGLMMHRLIMDAPKDMVVDHINGDGLDNRRENLRLATRQQNAINTNHGWGKAKYVGVSWDERMGKWKTQVHLRDPNTGRIVPHHLGYFDSEIEAARAHDRKRRELFRDFAKPNVPAESLPEEDQKHLFD